MVRRMPILGCEPRTVHRGIQTHGFQPPREVSTKLVWQSLDARQTETRGVGEKPEQRCVRDISARAGVHMSRGVNDPARRRFRRRPASQPKKQLSVVNRTLSVGCAKATVRPGAFRSRMAPVVHVFDDLAVLDRDQALRDHLLQNRQELLDAIRPVDNLDTHRKVGR